jgi:hypothetical protein
VCLLGIAGIYSIPIRVVKWERVSVGASPTPPFTPFRNAILSKNGRRS